MSNNYYNGNPSLKKARRKVNWTQERLEEFLKCSEDSIYFSEKYIKIVHVDHGFIPIKLYDYQKEIADKIKNSRRVSVCTSRQAGKTTTAVAVLLHYIIFNEHKTVALLANKGDAAREILDRIKIAYEALPDWMQQGVVSWNKGSIELENGCKVIAAATSSSAIRGKSISFLYIDEAAFVDHWDEFFASVFPTISSGETTKILFTSTPNGLNHFYRTCEGAKKKTNGYEYVEVPWQRVPGRTEKWKEETLAAMDFNIDKFNQEFCCEFLGNSGTLISTVVLKSLHINPPIQKALDGLDMYEEVDEKHSYIISVDCARGNGLDSSAFVVVDVSQTPYKVVAKYKNNYISPLLFPNVVAQVGRYYNMAYLLIENNDTGGQVADILYYDLDYDHMFFTEEKKASLTVSDAMKNVKIMGVRTTKKVKSQGCNAIKSLVENYQLKFEDYDIINEFSTFVVQANGTFSAEEGKHDDLAMCLVLFGWLSTQPFFRELTDVDIRKRIYEEQMRLIEQQLVSPIFSSELDAFEEKYGKVDNDIPITKEDIWFT
jgi:hypothetical protein